MIVSLRIVRLAKGLARRLAVLAALTVALNLPPVHAHAIVDSAPDGHLDDTCAIHGLAPGSGTHLPNAQGDCGHHFSPLVRATGVVLASYVCGALVVRDAKPSRQIYHGFDPPPPRLPA